MTPYIPTLRPGFVGTQAASSSRGPRRGYTRCVAYTPFEGGRTQATSHPRKTQCCSTLSGYQAYAVASCVQTRLHFRGYCARERESASLRPTTGSKVCEDRSAYIFTHNKTRHTKRQERQSFVKLAVLLAQRENTSRT